MDNKFGQLAANAQILSAIMGRPETGDFVVVEEPVPECISQGLAAQGMRFVGLMGVVDGVTRTELAEEISDEAIAGLVGVFVKQVMRVLAARLEQQERAAQSEPKDDFVAFMNGLTALPDTRD